MRTPVHVTEISRWICERDKEAARFSKLKKLAGITVAGNGAQNRNWTTGESLAYENRAQEIFRHVILGVWTGGRVAHT